MFLLVFLRFARVFLLFSLCFSPASYFRFCISILCIVSFHLTITSGTICCSTTAELVRHEAWASIRVYISYHLENRKFSLNTFSNFCLNTLDVATFFTGKANRNLVYSSTIVRWNELLLEGRWPLKSINMCSNGCVASISWTLSGC